MVNNLERYVSANQAAYGLGVQWAIANPGKKIPSSYSYAADGIHPEIYTLSTRSTSQFSKEFRRGVRARRSDKVLDLARV